MPESTPAFATAEPLVPVGVGEPRLLSRRALLLRQFVRTPGGMVGLALMLLVLVAAVFAGSIAASRPFEAVSRPLLPPSSEHLMGTDDLGRDVLSGVVHGARTTMVVVASVVGLSTAIGLAVGSIAAFRGGILDDLLMRVTELVQSLPRFFLAIVVVALFGSGLEKLVVLLGLTSWPMVARVVRAETLSLREREFVEAARSLGASEPRILLRHVLPNALPTTLVVVSLMGATVILLEASLGFLGLGDPNVMSWGYLANNAQRFMRAAWWMALFPGLAIMVAVLGLNLLGDAVNDLLNPLAARPAVVGRRRVALAENVTSRVASPGEGVGSQGEASPDP